VLASAGTLTNFAIEAQVVAVASYRWGEMGRPMTRFLANWEVETDITLPSQTPFIRYDHPAGAYTVFLRNIPERRNDRTFLSMQFIFDAPSIAESKEIAEPLAKEFLDHLAFASNLWSD
jgi:hypothetical protein